ncbi:MAG: PGF-pre-PGF domain-containing protein [Haloquadratum sp.]
MAEDRSRTKATDTAEHDSHRSRLFAVVAVALVVATGAVLPAAVAAQEGGGAPTVPAAYYGDVTVNGKPAPVGTVIVAIVDGERHGSITVTKRGQYGGPGALDEKLVVEGADPDDRVSFRVRGVAAEQTVRWESGDVREVDLTFTGVPEESSGGGGSGGGGSGAGGGGGAPAAPGSGSGGATPSGGATTGTPSSQATRTPGSTTAAPGATVVRRMKTNITAGTEAGNARATFEAASPVTRIRFGTDAASGTVTVVQLSSPPEATGSPPGESVAVAEIRVPDGLTEQAATIRMQVANERLDAIGVRPANLRITRFADGEWQSLETRVVDSGADGAVVAARTPGFSYFAVTAVSAPTARLRVAPNPATPGETVTLNGSASSTKHGEITAYRWSIEGRQRSGETATLALDDPGEYTVRLTVRTDAGRTDTASVTLSVSAAGETATPASDGQNDEAQGGIEQSGDGIPSETAGGLPPMWLVLPVVVVAAGGLTAAFLWRGGSAADERL